MPPTDTPGNAGIGPAALTAPWVDQWTAAVTGNPEIQVAGRWSRLRIAVQWEAGTLEMLFDAGTFAPYQEADGGGIERVVFKGSEAAWRSMLTSTPAPRRNDVLAMDRHHDDFAVTSGRESLIRHLRIILLVFKVGATTTGAGR
jgi:hypothetical protein